MAEIPVEKKSGMGWLWLLLLAILAALLIWWLVAESDPDVAVNDIETGEVLEADVVDEVDPALVVPAYAIGDSVNVDGVRVIEAVGDMAFTVDMGGETMLVLFNEVPTPNTATEGRFDINKGSMVDITGTVRDASAPLPDGVTATIPSGTEKYIYATELMTAAAQR